MKKYLRPLGLALAFCLARELRLPVDQLFFPDRL